MAYSRKKINLKRYLKRRKYFEVPSGKRIELRRKRHDYEFDPTPDELNLLQGLSHFTSAKGGRFYL